MSWSQFSQEKARILQDQTPIKLDGRFYMESHLRPCFDDSPRLELRRLREFDLVELADATELDSVGMRPVPSEEMLAYDKSEESIELAVEEPREDGTYRKRPNPEYKRVMKSLKAFENTALVLGIAKAPKPIWSKFTSTQPIAVNKVVYPGPRGLVKVFKPCAIQVNKSCLKVDNIEISQRCSPQAEEQRNKMRPQKNSLRPTDPKQSSVVTSNALNIPSELLRVFDLYENSGKLPKISQEKDWRPPKHTVKRVRSRAKVSFLHPKSSIKLFFCKNCQKIKKPQEELLSTLGTTEFPSGHHMAPRSDPSLEHFYQSLVQSLNKLSRKLPVE